MADHAATPAGVPIITADPYSQENLTSPHALYEQLREAGPVVYIERYGTWGIARYEQVNTVFRDWKTYSSAAGVGLSNFRKEKPWRPPSLLLESDPPTHTHAREALGPLLSPRALEPLREPFGREASALVDRLATSGSFDAVTQLVEVYTLKVFGDAVGLPDEGRERLLVYGTLLFNSFGPRNQLLEDAQAAAQDVPQWVADNCHREALRPGGFGAQLWALADTGKISEEWAGLLVRSLLGAGIDTTVNGINAAIYGLATHPDQWRLLREDPSLATAACEEGIRWDSPVQIFFRTTTRDVEIEGVHIPAGEKVQCFLGAANRDPRRWRDPDRFDLKRDTAGHLGFGMGVHRCIGLSVARLETEVLLAVLARRVDQIEISGQPRRKPNNTLHAWASLPLAVHSAPA